MILMNIDWAVAVFLFIVFVAWSLVYFSGLGTHSIEGSFVADAGKIVDMFSVDVYRIPALYNSSYTGTGLLYADMDWKGGERNTTRVYQGGRPLDCMISGDTVVWRADVSKGINDFVIEYSNNKEPLNCTAIFSGLYNHTLEGVREYRKEISISRVESVVQSDYESVRESLGITGDFRVEIEAGGEGFVYGPAPPFNVDVHSVERSMYIAGSRDIGRIRVLMWQGV